MTFQSRRNLRIQLRRRLWLVAQDGAANLARAVALERHLAGRHLVQHRAKGEQVGARVQFLGLHLLRRHVGHCAQHRARAGQVLRLRRRSSLVCRRWRRGLARHLGQPEVENLGVPALGDEDVGGLDVAMNDAFACAASSASAISIASGSSCSVSTGLPAIRCFSVMPSRNSMAMNARPSSSPMS